MFADLTEKICIELFYHCLGVNIGIFKLTSMYGL